MQNFGRLQLALLQTWEIENSRAQEMHMSAGCDRHHTHNQLTSNQYHIGCIGTKHLHPE